MSSDEDFIFVHIPKTAGQSIKKMLFGRTGGPHRSIFEINYDQEKPFSFAFVRNPWDRLLSSYLYSEKYLKRKHKSLESYIKYGPTHSWSTHVKPQTSFIKDRGGLIAMDFIGRFENLHDDFSKVCKKIGVNSELHHHVFQTEHKHYSEYYDPYLKDYVSKKYEEEIEYFNYKF